MFSGDSAACHGGFPIAGSLADAGQHGMTINGPGSQSGVAFAFDGRTLYFNAAKDSRPGFGKYDLFVTARTRVPENGPQ